MNRCLEGEVLESELPSTQEDGTDDIGRGNMLPVFEEDDNNDPELIIGEDFFTRRGGGINVND